MFNASIEHSEGFVLDFLKEYLADGIGAMPKKEIDILVMNLLMKYAGLAEKGNQELSILLQSPVSRIKNLRYEARLKYPPDADYVKREFLYTLARSQLDFEKDKIVFLIEDEYLRQSIHGRLKSRGMFADSSFNTELIKIDEKFLKAVIAEFYGEKVAEDFQSGFDDMKAQLRDKHADPQKTFQDTIIHFAMDTARLLAFEFVKSRIGL